MSKGTTQWKETTLADEIEIISGGTPKTSVASYWGGDTPWLSVSDFNNVGRWVYGASKHITQEGVENSATSVLKEGDLILSARGTVGALAQLATPMAFNQSCYGIRAKSTTQNDFLYYLIKNNIKQFLGNVHGSVFDTITRSTFEQIKIKLPELSEQNAIENVFSVLDKKIELLRKQNETLEEIARAVFHEWFVEFNFPNKDGEPYKASGGKMVVSELGEIPDGWRVGSMGEVVDIFDNLRIPLSSAERSKRKGQYPYYGATSVMDYIDDHLFDGEYLLLGEDGSVVDTDGFPILQYVYGKFWVNNHAHVLKGKNLYSTSMVYLLFRSTKVTDIVTGAVQLKINQNNLLKKKIVVAENNIVEKVGNFFTSCFIKRRENERQIAELAEIRDTLLPKLMSGEIKVKI